MLFEGAQIIMHYKIRKINMQTGSLFTCMVNCHWLYPMQNMIVALWSRIDG